MHINTKELQDNSIIEGDICIVGAGAAGISIALEYLNTPYNVILLEGGGFEYDEEVQQSHAGTNIGHTYFPIQTTRLHKFGGTTALWSGACSVLDDIDFEKRAWIENSGWPIVKNDLIPYYKKAHTNLDLGPFEYDVNYWIEKNPNLKPIPFQENMFWNKMWQFSPPSRFDQKYRTVIEKSKNITLYTYAKATDIQCNKDLSEIQNVLVRNSTGKSHVVKAKYFILACGAIQNARLLLASNGQHRNGLGNEHDNVGRYFMEHIEVGSAELWLSTPNKSLDLYLDKHSTNSIAELSLSAETQVKHQTLNGTISFVPLKNYLLSKPKLERWSNENPLLNQADKKRNFLERIGRKVSARNIDMIHNIGQAFKVYSRFEQAPNRNSRVLLDPNKKDSLGVPLINLDWQFTALEKKSIRKINQLFAMQVGAIDFGRVRLDEYLRDENDTSIKEFMGGFHHMGTTRMSENSKNGVVDANCKVHAISNLFVAGSSCFPTCGGPNPTLTLVALSLRLSDHVKALLSNKSIIQ